MGDSFIVRRGGSGGGGLNFSVVAQTVQPTGKENLIWANTSIPLTDWVISPSRPTTRTDGTPLSGGELWIAIGASSTAPINAAKKNGVYLNPVKAEIYDDNNNAWIPVTAQTYQGGEWKDWITYLFFNGNIYPDVANWKGLKMGLAGGFYNTAVTQFSPTMNFGSDSITLYGAYTETPVHIDVNAMKRLRVEFANRERMNTNAPNGVFFVKPSKLADFKSAQTKAAVRSAAADYVTFEKSTSGSGAYTGTFDFINSSLATDDYHICICYSVYTAGMTHQISEVALEY